MGVGEKVNDALIKLGIWCGLRLGYIIWHEASRICTEYSFNNRIYQVFIQVKDILLNTEKVYKGRFFKINIRRYLQETMGNLFLHPQQSWDEEILSWRSSFRKKDPPLMTRFEKGHG